MRLFCTCCVLFSFLSVLGCKEKEVPLNEQLLGSWIQADELTYIGVHLNPEGMWDSNVKIANPRSRIVAFKGNASGTWYVQEKQLVMAVVESTIEKAWKKDKIYSFQLGEILPSRILLTSSKGKQIEWEREAVAAPDGQEPDSVISMAPIAVNLDKISSNTKDSYLCVKMKLLLKELMPGSPVPVMHPRVRDAAVLFLSSLIYDKVRNFEALNVQKEALLKALNPYLSGAIKEIELEDVLIATSPEKVEEFCMKFAPSAEEETPGEEEE